MTQPTLKQLTDWALEAGELLLRMQHEDMQLAYKDVADPVTAADKASEALLISRIHAAFPGHSIVAEESGLHTDDPDHQWFIDPIDGTINYAHSLPIYAVSLAYAYKGELQVGVVYAPAMKELYTAEKGKGAQLNGEPLQVSGISEMRDALLVTGFRTKDFGTPRSNLPAFVHFSKLTQTVRRLGSAALDMVYIAAGRVDGFWELALNPWDIAAAVLIVREAGGLAENLVEGKSLLEGKVDVVAGNPHIFPQVKREYHKLKEAQA